MQNQSQPQRISQNTPRSELDIWLRDFLLDVRAANRSEATIGYYEDKLKPFLAFLQEQGVENPALIRATHLRAFLVHLGESRGSGGVHAYWRAVRAFVRFLVREDALERNPLDKMRSPKLDQDLLDPIPTEDIQALIATCEKDERGLRDKAILLILLDTGLRAGELISLTIGDVNPTDGSISIRKTKSRKGRFVFLGRQSRRALAAYLRTRDDNEPTAPLIVAYQRNEEQTQLSYDGLRDILKRRAKKAQIDAPTLHGFRRSFAISMLRSGADIVSLSRMMGHGSLPILTRYLKQMKDDLSDVHAQHSPTDRL